MNLPADHHLSYSLITIFHLTPLHVNKQAQLAVDDTVKMAREISSLVFPQSTNAEIHNQFMDSLNSVDSDYLNDTSHKMDCRLSYLHMATQRAFLFDFWTF